MNLENLDVLSQKIESMLDALRRLKNEKAESDKALASKISEITALQGELDGKNAEVENFKAILAEKDAELEKSKADLAAKDAELGNLQATVADIRAEQESLKGALAEKDAKTAELEGVVNEQGAEIQTAREKFQNLLSTIENELGTEIPVQTPEDGAESAQPESAGQDAPQGGSAQVDFFG